MFEEASKVTLKMKDKNDVEVSRNMMIPNLHLKSYMTTLLITPAWSRGLKTKFYKILCLCHMTTKFTNLYCDIDADYEEEIAKGNSRKGASMNTVAWTQ
ncbi:hypothetical protein CTI12_AA166800 [Artemisia annua]|uniref:Uncharacterized protein n=1 Tax=Artemisia annua TaxID=35608 RepID=A0A2U1MX12_ARTAN|nr:hypothetical protein CTI12_AA166800 [Artemisia annua]